MNLSDTCVTCFEVFPSQRFDDDVEYLIKKKKFKRLPLQLKEIVNKLRRGELKGVRLKNLNLPDNSYAYKMRMENKDTNEGKSNGYRIIYYIEHDKKVIVLATIYYKKDKATISDGEIVRILRGYINED